MGPIGFRRASVRKAIPIRKASLTSKSLAQKIAHLASDKKGLDITVLDMKKVVNFCDYFVLCSGTSDRHVKAIADGIGEGLADMQVRFNVNQGLRDLNWIVVDIGDVVAHVFQKQVREFYNLEYLWQQAKKVDWEVKKAAKPKAVTKKKKSAK